MEKIIELFSTSQCPKCFELGKFLENKNIQYVKRVIDIDADAETDALMLNIISAPALRIGSTILKSRDIFINNTIDEKKLSQFII